MSSRRGATKSVVDEEQLRLEIQGLLDEHGGRPPRVQISVERVWLDDGCWRALVRPKRRPRKMYDYADLLASVEEELLDRVGVNVMLTSARD